MILGEFGPIFSDTLFTQTACNRNIDISLSDLNHVRGTFFKSLKEFNCVKKKDFQVKAPQKNSCVQVSLQTLILGPTLKMLKYF